MGYDPGTHAPQHLYPADHERILRMHASALEAGEIIQVGTLDVKYEITLSDVTRVFFPYLTMVEGIKLAVLTFHKDVPVARDKRTPEGDIGPRRVTGLLGANLRE